MTDIDQETITIPDFVDRRVVIPGGTGAVGEGIVRQWLRTGADVIVPSRTEEKKRLLVELLGIDAKSPKLHFVVGDYTSFPGATQTADRITDEFGPVTDVVTSIGGWWQGKPLWEVDPAEWDRYFVGFTTAHFATARAWIPRLADRGSYQMILGGSATQPVPGASIINMEQAALLMMRSVLAAEVGGKRRVASQVLGPVATRQRTSVDPAWVSNAEVGLVSIGIAANEHILDVDYVLRHTDQVRALLTEFGILATGGGL